MRPTDDDIHNLTEADRTSQTRFGPRPVPKGHKTASPYPHKPMRASRVIPSAPMSPDGRHAYPAPSLSSKIIVWGGVALGVAGLTAGALMAARKLSDSGSEDRPRPHRRATKQRTHAPAFAGMTPDEQEAVRRRVRDQARRDSRESAQARATAAERRAPPRGNLAHELTDTANDLSRSLNGVAQSLVAAFQGFRSVAAQAKAIVSEFAEAAESVRSALRDGHDDGRPAADQPARRGDDDPDERRRHNL
ncbi:hypothetical protein [Paracoccus salsus]|uniref:hypothetical protein n=1 Tax=Paracoccus salsus TaxID=2911061 RepID=UPI001F471595|nr:hypothetical protein [Paracoccus salsus]MCF3973897.1 hypothetical protein [Paracoccus salsus]